VGQVIGNILDNAVKYSPQGGEIVVRLEEWEGNYLVSVTDQGIGVSPEHFDHIFEHFYRVHNTASREYAGIGLGLFVAKAIVDGHGGKIWLTNNQHGIGTTFHFTLPRKPSSKDDAS
jgi:signal transduction histidine kinase